MPSPFPGMDPFIEGQVWRDFHTAMLLAIRKALVQLVRPRYVVNVEEYVYLVADNDTTQKLIAPDVRIAESHQAWPTATSADVDADVMLQPESAGPLTFGPAGVLFVGDPQGAQLYAIGG